MRRNEITNAILDTLTTNIPSVPWTSKIIGVATSNAIEGTVACDSVTFQYDAKDSLVARATYYIYIVDLNSTNDVESVADQAFSVLNNSDLDGALIVGDIVRINYGVSPGKPNSSAVLLEYVVEYYEN